MKSSESMIKAFIDTDVILDFKRAFCDGCSQNILFIREKTDLHLYDGTGFSNAYCI